MDAVKGVSPFDGVPLVISTSANDDVELLLWTRFTSTPVSSVVNIQVISFDTPGMASLDSSVR